MSSNRTCNIWSFRPELTYVTASFLLVLLLPFIAVMVITQAGINAVSEALVSVDQVTRTISIKNPADGSVSTVIETAITWPAAGIITLEFGETSLYQLFHTGLDIAGRTGDPVTAAIKGQVIHTGELSWGYGRHVIIDHGDNIHTIYAHLHTITTTVGNKVAAGQVIGTQGQTGWATGPHLHFQINVYGIPVNPRTFLGN
jgi:murein DD-endopeptidase MepM/ murein hydrolase activator NlpD